MPRFPYLLNSSSSSGVNTTDRSADKYKKESRYLSTRDTRGGENLRLRLGYKRRRKLKTNCNSLLSFSLSRK